MTDSCVPMAVSPCGRCAARRSSPVSRSSALALGLGRQQRHLRRGRAAFCCDRFPIPSPTAS